MKFTMPQFVVTCLILMGIIGIGTCSVGCTSASTKIALEASNRVTQIQDKIQENQNKALKWYIFQKLLTDINAAKTSDQVAALLNKAWQDRDLVEFWAVQWERARALHIIGVEAKLYSDEGILDLIWKQLSGKGDEFWGAVKGQLAGSLAEKLLTPETK